MNPRECLAPIKWMFNLDSFGTVYLTSADFLCDSSLGALWGCEDSVDTTRQMMIASKLQTLVGKGETMTRRAQFAVAAAFILASSVSPPIAAQEGASEPSGAPLASAEAVDDVLARAAADADSVELLYQLSGVRNQYVTDRLTAMLKAAAARSGISRIVIYSGGQPGTTGQSIGSVRHNAGNAADLQLYVGDSLQRFDNNSAPQTITDFVTAAAALGATGIGAATDYMGPTSLHVGYGMPRTIWGRGGRRANAPGWLVQAFNAGPVSVASAGMAQYYTVIARNGASMREGPGSQYDPTETIPTDTLVSVLGFDGPDGEWARVDLVGDGYFDGHMHISTLSPAGSGLALDHVESVDGEVSPGLEVE